MGRVSPNECEVGVVWKGVGDFPYKYHRCEIRVRYQGKEIGFADSALLELDATNDTCVRFAKEAALNAIDDAIDFVDYISNNSDSIQSDLFLLKRGFTILKGDLG